MRAFARSVSGGGTSQVAALWREIPRVHGMAGHQNCAGRQTGRLAGKG